MSQFFQIRRVSIKKRRNYNIITFLNLTIYTLYLKNNYKLNANQVCHIFSNYYFKSREREREKEKNKIFF
jgi:hypothetical protein